jgi:hypothetical protein
MFEKQLELQRPFQEAGVNDVLQKVKSGQKVLVPQNGDITKATVAEQTPKAQVLGQAPTVGMFATPQDGYREATPEEADQFTSYATNAMESFKVVRELRNVAKTGVDPIRPVLEEKSFWGTAERGAYGLSGSIPLMGATAVNPYLGVLAYQATEYDRIMLENPEINPQFAQGLALVEGAANAAIDRVQLSSLSGRLPMFGRYLDRIASNGVRRTVKIGANVVEQNLQEGAQDLIAPVLETAVAALREDMPDKDFGKLLNEWGGQRAETFFATLPLALIGGGVATYRDIKNPSAELNATKLRMAGFGQDQVTFIQRAENPEEYDARIQMEWEKRTSENIKAGEQEVLNTIEKARTPGELDARIERVTAPDGSEDIVVTSPDGRELLRTKSEQAALEAVRQHNEAQLINERNAVSDMVDYFRAQDPTNEATIEAPRTVQQELDRLTEAGDSKGIANLNERIRFAGIPEGSDLTTYNILGEANVETTAEGVFRGVIKLRENSRPEDAFEEINHVFVRKALAEGRTDLDSLRGWLNQTSEATGETYATDTETDIIENIAKVGMDYAAGRIEETSLPASFVDYIKRMLQVFKETMARAIKLKDAFATGKIDSNFESFLAESVGLNQQTMVDTTRERASGDIITDGGQMLMDFSIGSRSNAVSTDTPSIRASNATITGPANYSIAAHHGTPHKVDKFSTAKIGTGEGAQAYGWGLYFAQAKAVGEGYRDQLGGIRLMTADGQMADNIVSTPGAKKILKEARAFWKQTKSLDGFVKQLEASKSQSKVWAAQGDNVESNSQYVKDVDEVLTAIKDTTPTPTGNLYTAELDVEPEDLLDWDKPFSEQSPKVQAALKAVQSDHPLWKDTISGKNGKPVGGAIYKTLTATWPDAEFARDGIDPKKKASEALLAAGIPGIRYLDGGSRSVNATDDRLLELAEKNNGNKEAAVDEFMRSVYDTPKAKEKMRSDLLRNFPERTSNYVVFDENLIKITEENGNRIPASQALAAPATGATNYSIGKKDKEVVVNPDETTEPGTPAPDTGIEILDPDQEGEDIPWGPTNYSIGPRSLPEVFPTIDKKLFNKIKKETSTIAAIHIDRMKVGELMGIPLQGGMFYPSIVENLKAGVVWAFNAPNVARTVARRAAANGGYVKLVLMQEGNVIGNKTFTHVWFASLEQNISSGAITKATALGELNRVRELFSNHSDSKLSTGHKKKWKSLEEAKNAIISLPQQKRASTYFKKTKVETKGEGVKIAYQQLLSKKNTKLGMPDPITLVEQMEEPAFKGMPTGAIVGIIKIDPIKDSDPILTGQQAGVPTHLSYDYVLKGKPVAKMKKITVLDEAFPETKNQILTQQHTDFPLAGAINYSIASQSEIDRVNKALGGMNRGPDERLKVYERARAKFQGVMERNREALESLNKDTAKFRRTQLLQGLGELDAILSVFPPDIRGRVGGYTKLANIAPMDVFKDGEKVSEVSGMNGALISAWMRQGMSIGQAGQQTELPPGYTTKENLATARADRALADFFKQRIGMIDREVEKSLRKEYDEAFRKLLDRTKPKKAAPGEKPKGIGADIQDLFTVVRSAVGMDAVSVAAHIAGLDAKIASGELTAEQEARAQVEAALVSLVGDWRNADADRRRSALTEATRIWSGAYAAHAQKVIQLREQREVARMGAIQDTGKSGELAGRKSKAIADSGLKGSWKDYILNLLNFDQVTGILFGENSKTANTLIDRQRATENAKEDGQQEKMQALEGFFTDLAGGNLLAGEQLRYNLAQPSMEVQGIKLSELEGLSAAMMWEQEDGRRHMTGELDETGKPSGSWHYDQDFVDDIIANLSPEALQLRDWLLKQYADEYGNINAVYAELNGV